MTTASHTTTHPPSTHPPSMPLLPLEGERPRPLLPGYVPAPTREHDTPANRAKCLRLGVASARLHRRAEAAWRAYSEATVAWDLHLDRFLADTTYQVPEAVTTRVDEALHAWRFWCARHIATFNRWQALYWALDELGCRANYGIGGQALARTARPNAGAL